MEIGGRNDQLMPYDGFAPKAPKGKGAQKSQERTQESQNRMRIRISCAFVFVLCLLCSVPVPVGQRPHDSTKYFCVPQPGSPAKWKTRLKLVTLDEVASTLNKPGPRKVLRPTFPKVPAAGTLRHEDRTSGRLSSKSFNHRLCMPASSRR